MPKRMIAIVTVLFALFLTLAFAGSGDNDLTIDPSQYPEIGEKEMGQLRWALALGEQPVEDFSNMDARDQFGMTSYRYLIAFTTYFLALEQYEKIPAYPELIKPKMDRLIAKMIQKPVWEYWAEVSKGVPKFEPKFNRPYPEEHDPVGKKNIMYSGHLGHMAALYEMLYRDMKWSESGAMTFVWDEKEKFVYDNNSLQTVMYEQMKNNPWHAIECEPNLCFPECNQHPFLGFMLYDAVHGTNYASVKVLLQGFFDQERMINPRHHETAAFYLVKQKVTLSGGPIGSNSANGWTGAMMHAWNPELIEKVYPKQRDGHVSFRRNGEARLDSDPAEKELSYGFFAMLAAEVGDTKTRDMLLARTDRVYAPEWKDGKYHYPYNVKRKCTHLTDKLLALARAMKKNSLFDMHNSPFDKAHFKEPFIANVDFPKVLISRAIWDRKNSALIVTIEPGIAGQGGETSFTVKNLDSAKTYALFVSGKQTGTISGATENKITLNLIGKTDVILVERK